MISIFYWYHNLLIHFTASIAKLQAFDFISMSLSNNLHKNSLL